MKVSTVQQAQQAVYDKIRAMLFTRIHGRPARRQYDKLLEECADVAVLLQLPAYPWSDKYGILAEVLGAQEYLTTTGLVYVEPTPPTAFNGSITASTSQHVREPKTAKHEQLQERYFIWQGGCKAVCDNIRDALDEQYYHQLKRRITGYAEVKIFDFLDHIAS